MRIVVTTTTPDLDSPVDPRFGRGAYFVVVDTSTLEWQAHPNPAAAASGGAGIRAAQFVAEQKAQAVISGDFGPQCASGTHGRRCGHVPVWGQLLGPSGCGAVQGGRA